MATSGTISTAYKGWTYQISWKASQSIADNKSTITCTHKLVCDTNYSLYIGERSNSCTAGTTKSFTSPSISTGGGKTITLGTTTHSVTHNDDGSKSVKITGTFNIKATLSGVYKESITASKTVTLDPIPRKATITSAPNFNDEENPTINYSNPAGTAVTTLQACISLDGSKADIAYRNISKTGSSYTFNLTDPERTVLREATTTSNTRKVKFYVKTVIGENTYYSNVEKTLTIINNKPVFTSSQLSYADTNTEVTAITKNPLMIVQNKSNLKVTYTKATGQKAATISKYTFTLNGVTKSSTADGGTINFGKINSEKDLTLSVTVTDSRGNINTVTKTIECYKYYSPSFIDFKAYRTDEDGNIDANGAWIKCEYTTNIASVDGKNARTIQIHGVGENSIPASGDSHKIDLNGDKDTTYKIYATVTDLFSGSNSSTMDTVFGASRIINIHPSGTGIAFGKKADKENLFDCQWDVQFKGKSILDLTYPVGSIYMSANSTNPATLFGGTWKAIEGQFLIGRNSTYTTAGGSSTVKLTVDNMPSHTHTFTGSKVTTSETGSHQHEVPDTRGSGADSSTTARLESWEAAGTSDRKPMTTSAGDHTHTVTAAGTNSNTGSGQAFSIMPPYLPVYMWQRTA